MNKKIFFYDSKQCNKFMALGQTLEFIWACYSKGIELGYNEIIIEWHHRISIMWFDDGRCIQGMPKPKNNILPITFVRKGVYVNADKYIDISEQNSLYEGCPPLISNKSIIASTFENYLNNNRKTLSVTKTKTNPYILIHYRKSTKKSQQIRNILDEHYINIIKLVRKRFKEIPIYKIGEPSSFDDMFDRVYKYFLRDTTGLIDLVGNSTLYIGPLSGPISIAFFNNNDCIAMKSEREDNIEYKKPNYCSDNVKLISLREDYIEDINDFIDCIYEGKYE